MAMADEAGQEARLTMALPKGRLSEEVGVIFARAGLPMPEGDDGRLLIDHEGGMRFLTARPSDVVTYVREGAADLGVTGKDILLDRPEGYYELLDLGVGTCRLSVAGVLPPGRDWAGYLAQKGNSLRVATKHPVATRNYFATLGLTPTVIPLSGALELAPQVGLADVIVDLIATGRTLQANGLVEMALIAPITARLVANPVAYRFKATPLERVVTALRAALGMASVSGGAGGGGGDASV